MNEINEVNKINQINQINQMDKINEMNELNVKGLMMGPLDTFAHLPAGGTGAFGA